MAQEQQPDEQPCCSCTGPAGQQPRHSRLATWVVATACRAAHGRLLPHKRRLFEPLSRERGVHTVVEVGLGSAPNLELYASQVDHIIGVDNNAASQEYARAAAAEAGLPPDRLRLVAGFAEALPLADASADAVVATHLLCSVSNQERVLAEVKRVLRPGGRYVFVEHVAAAPGTLMYVAQRWAAPLVRWAADCDVSRQTLDSIRMAGFSAVDAQEFWIPAGLWGPHIAGTAVR